jgi:hypothetical protein
MACPLLPTTFTNINLSLPPTLSLPAHLVRRRYDPQSNRWLPGPPLTRKRFALGGAELGGALYAVGGYDGDAYLACAERLDPRTDRWVVGAGGCVGGVGASVRR